MGIRSSLGFRAAGFLAAFSAVLLGYLMALQMPQAAFGNQPVFCRGSSVEQIGRGVAGPSVHGISVALQAKHLEPGQDLYARLLNRGTSRATYGPQHRIERYVNDQWTVDPASPHGPWLKVFWLLSPDRAGRCFHYVIPGDQSAGLYRFVIPVKTDYGRSGRSVTFRVG